MSTLPTDQKYFTKFEQEQQKEEFCQLPARLFKLQALQTWKKARNFLEFYEFYE